MLLHRSTSNSDENPTAFDAFHIWLGKAGVKLNEQLALAGKSALDGGRGLIVKGGIESGAAVISVPQSLGVTARSLENSGIARYIKGFEGWTGGTGLIALQVLWERALGAKSSIEPWINVLPAPEDLDLPLFWGEDDLALADASSTRVS